MKLQDKLYDFISKEWLLIASIAVLVGTSIYLHRSPVLSIAEYQILFILAVLFIVIKGLEQSGLILRLSQSVEKEKFIPLKLIVITFLLAMLITNDVALIVIVPLTLELNINRKDIIVILEALAANAGSALTPFGNPQNLFIYWFYKVRPETFVAAIAPFSLVFLVLLILAAIALKTSNSQVLQPVTTIRRSAYIYATFLLGIILVVLHILPIQVGFIVVAFVLFFDRDSLQIDYALLLTFVAFFGIADNVQCLFAENIKHSGHIFMLSSLLSQIISNVPAALLFARFTPQWEALLWGTNVGGFGSLVGSLANLIAYKLYISHEDTNNSVAFTTKFLLIGYMAFAIGVLLYLGRKAVY